MSGVSADEESVALHERQRGFVETLRRERVVVVIRQANPETILPTLQALHDGGLRVFEITVEVPGALPALDLAYHNLPVGSTLGAGTVLDGATAAAAIRAGAQFLVSPVLARSVGATARARGVPCVLGGMTPSEVQRAFRLGSPAVKVFPASAVGPRFVRELRGPLSFIPLVPTGGITLENARSFLDAGASAVGVGSALVKREWVEGGKWEHLAEEARSWAELKWHTESTQA